MFHNFGYEGCDIFKEAENLRYELKHPYVGTEHLLLALLKEDEKIISLCSNYGLTYQTFLNELDIVVGHASKAQELNLYTPMLKRVLELALSDAAENNQGRVTGNHFFLAILEEGEGIAVRILTHLGIDLDSLYDDLKESKEFEKKKKNLEIMKIGIALTQNQKNMHPLLGQDKELLAMIETLLRKQKNNPLLIGKAGVGKTAIVEELARRISKKQVPKELQNMEIYELEMGSLVAGTKYRGEFEERLTKIIKEVIREKNIIIFIDEIHSMVNAGGAEGAICAADILKPYLARGELKVIGSTTLNEYHEFIAKDKALDRRFEHILVEEPNDKEMMNILLNIKPVYESFYNISLTKRNMADLLECANQYIFSKNNPDKTIDLLDSVCARIKVKTMNQEDNSIIELEDVVRKKETYLKQGSYQKALYEAKEEEKIRRSTSVNKQQLTMTKKDILEVIESKTHMILRHDITKVYTTMKSNLFKNIVGQDDVIQKLVDEMKCYSRKVGSFLLIGGSGVGKTETVKIISNTLQTKLLRIDMSEFHLEESINRLLGAPSGYVGYGNDYVFRSLIDEPYTTVLFDEIEKAHPKVLNLLLQILDEGFVTDRLGNKIRFDHTFIFLTSNVKPSEKIGFSSSFNNALEQVLSKELIGRIDAIIPFHDISEEVALEYINQHLKNKIISKEQLLLESNYQKYGIRGLKTLIHKYNKKTMTCP